MSDELFARPTAAELVTAAREWLEGTLLFDVPAEHAFHLRVTINALATVERELVDGARLEAQHEHRLAALGVASDADLCSTIRDDAAPDGTYATILADVEARLAVSNPTFAADWSD